MAKCNSFRWLVNDINSTLVLKVVSRNINDGSDYGTYCIHDILENDWDELNIKTANIDDLTNFLTLGIVRFVNVGDMTDIIDIPFRNLYKLYDKAYVLGYEQKGKLISFKEVDTFSIIDGRVRNDLMIYSAVVDKVSDDLSEIMKIAGEFGRYGMQRKFDALTRVMNINHQRLIEENKMKVI